MFCYSDMPIDADIPNFMHNSRVLQYLRDYATRFDLLKHIRYNTQVVKVCVWCLANSTRVQVTQSDDYASTGRWLVTTDAGETRVFDGVLVCTGHHAFPNRPDMPGLKQFKVATESTLAHTLPCYRAK
jgi:dimethylaniline monooxygenase (N-oxide forming)